MNNTYKERYYEIIKELREKKYNFFERFEETIVLPYDITLGIKPQEKRVVVKLRINGMLLCNAYELAKIKAKYTNDRSQSGKERPMDIKVMNQLKGILAEIGVQLILEEVLGLDDVKRWDLERESFEYSTAEYDLKFSIGNKEYFCESRSSTSYKTTLSEFLSTCHLMLPMPKGRGFCKANIEAPSLSFGEYHFLNFLLKSSIPLVFLKKLRKLSIGTYFNFRSTNRSVSTYQR